MYSLLPLKNGRYGIIYPYGPPLYLLAALLELKQHLCSRRATYLQNLIISRASHKVWLPVSSSGTAKRRCIVITWVRTPSGNGNVFGNSIVSTGSSALVLKTRAAQTPSGRTIYSFLIVLHVIMNQSWDFCTFESVVINSHLGDAPSGRTSNDIFGGPGATSFHAYPRTVFRVL